MADNPHETTEERLARIVRESAEAIRQSREVIRQSRELLRKTKATPST
jgi:hypothetical protein